jgi:hypothetical protein
VHASWLIMGRICRPLLLWNITKHQRWICTGRDRAKSRSPERYMSHHDDHDEKYYESRHRDSRDVSRKRYALDGIDSPRKHDDEDNRRSTRRTRGHHTRGRSLSPTAVRWITTLPLLNPALISEDVCKICELTETQRRR